MRQRPPGWYPDASVPGYERWWDGGTWSHVTRPGPGPAAAAAREATAAREAARQAGAAEAGAAEAGGRPDPYAGPPGYQPPPGYRTPPGYPSPPGYPPAPGYPGAPSYPGQPGYPYVPPGAAPTTPDGMALSRAGWRLLARIIDGFLVAIVTVALGFPFIGRILDGFRDYLDKMDAAAHGAGPQPGPFEIYTTGGFLAGYVGLLALQVVVSTLYSVTFIALRGATLGKMAAGIRVRPWEQDGLPGWGRAVKRALGYEVASMIPFVGGWYALLDELWLLWDPRRQCLHDKWPATVVVRTRP